MPLGAGRRIRHSRDWPSGVYVGKLTAERDGLQSYVIFIVRDDRACDFLFQCADTTWSAYNRWPDQYVLYDDGHKEWYIGPENPRELGSAVCEILPGHRQPVVHGSGSFMLWEFPLAYLDGATKAMTSRTSGQRRHPCRGARSVAGEELSFGRA